MARQLLLRSTLDPLSSIFHPRFRSHPGRGGSDVPRSGSSLALCAEMRDDWRVSTVAEIKKAIARLSPQEYCELMAELFPHEDDEWDKQMKADAEAGRLDFIDREVEQAKREGTLIPLEKILAEDENSE